MNTRTQFKWTCIASIMVDIAFILSVIYKILKYGNNNVGCMIASIIGLLISILVAVQILYKIEYMMYLRMQKSLLEESQKIKIKALIEAITIVLVLI